MTGVQQIRALADSWRPSLSLKNWDYKLERNGPSGGNNTSLALLYCICTVHLTVNEYICVELVEILETFCSWCLTIID